MADRNDIERILDAIDMPRWMTDDNEFTYELDQCAPGMWQVRLSCYLPCTKTGALAEQVGRWFTIHEPNDRDSIIRTVWMAFQTFMLHEMLEGFKYHGVIVFDPHSPLNV
ncbi:hypothetical protein AVU67_gp10 [Ralstonia phage RSJ2]|uniref:Uncharacterized protein n=1 Tax=Ralstonia phage RSJ2 TaxID=1481785 RepID=A0A068Q5Q3_9CAUD|nr:hypothetical protein AVU67_gp10 [Ralstonia phage RSJ2]BAP15816.1 hypothetical protein [Ralstonia phage RSJ2]